MARKCRGAAPAGRLIGSLLTALAAVLPLHAGVRAISAMDIAEKDDGACTCTLDLSPDAGSAAQALYFVWSAEGDKGEALSAWPQVLRIGTVAADVTELSFALPPAAAATLSENRPSFAARAFLAASEKNYDYLVSKLTGSGSTQCFLDTGFKPVEGQTVVTVDCVYPKIASDVFLFGCYNDKYSFCCYFNNSKAWTFACNDNTPVAMPTAHTGAVNERVRVTLDATGANATTGTVTIVATGERFLAVNANPHTKTGVATSYNRLFLWGRSTGANVNNKSCTATVYSCVITNNGVCVRDYRPAVRNGTAGLWDAVNNTFTASAGTSAFQTVGSNVTFFVAAGDVQTAVSPLWRPMTETVHEWTGAAGDGRLTTPGNWSGGAAPDLTDGRARLVFGGEAAEAVVSGEIRVSALSFVSSGAFTLTAEDARAKILLGGSLTTENPSGVGTAVVTIGVPLELVTSDRAWTVAAQTALRLAAPLSTPAFETVPLAVKAPGRVDFLVDNPDLTAPLTLTGLTASNRPRVCAPKGLGAPSRAATFRGALPQFDTSAAPAVNEVPLIVEMSGSGNDLAFNTSKNHPLHLKGLVTILNTGDKTGLATVADGTVFFDGGLRKASGGIELHLNGGNVSVSNALTVAKIFYIDGIGTLSLAATNNSYTIINPYKATVVCRGDNVFAKEATLEIGSSTAGKYRQTTATIDLNGFNQRIRRLKRGWNYNETLSAQFNGYGTITSASPAVLEVASDITETTNIDRPKTYVSAAFCFAGAAGFHFCGTGVFGFTNRTSTTVGGLHVSSGTVNLWTGGGWTATTNVVVDGTGTLHVRAGAGATAFGPAAGASACALTLAGDGTLAIAAGETATVSTLWNENAHGLLKAVPPGVYAGADAGLPPAQTLARLSGAGYLRVLRRAGAALVILLR